MPTESTDLEISEIPSRFTFEQTLERVTTTIVDAGMTIFAVVDHARGAADIGLSMPPTTVLMYGHPRGGTPIMQAFPLAALDLPLRALVRADAEGHVFLAFHPVAPELTKSGVPESLSRRLIPAQRLLVDAVKA